MKDRLERAFRKKVRTPIKSKEPEPRTKTVNGATYYECSNGYAHPVNERCTGQCVGSFFA